MVTPNEKTWAGVSKLPEYKLTFPQWQPQNFRKRFNNFDKDGLDLLEKFFTNRSGKNNYY